MKLRYYLDLLTFLVLMVSYIYFILEWKVHRQRNRDFRSEFIALRIRKEKQDPTLTIEEESRYEALYEMGATNAVIHALSNIRSATCLWSYGLLFFTKMLLTKLHSYLAYKSFGLTIINLIDLLLIACAVIMAIIWSKWTKNPLTLSSNQANNIQNRFN